MILIDHFKLNYHQRHEACLCDIPVGARFQDPEIASAISMNTTANLVDCSQLVGQSIHEDIAAMFAQIHMQKVTLGGKFLQFNKEKVG